MTSQTTTFYRQGFRANLSALQEKDLALQTREELYFSI